MHLEDFTPGLSVTTPVQEVTSEMVEEFARLSGLDLAMFLTAEGARAQGHDRPIVPAPLILSLAMGLMRQTGWFDRVIAVAGFDAMRFLQTVHHGDQLSITAEVRAVRPPKPGSSRPNAGLVELAYTGHNQRGEKVFSSNGLYLYPRRGA